MNFGGGPASERWGYRNAPVGQTACYNVKAAGMAGKRLREGFKAALTSKGAWLLPGDPLCAPGGKAAAGG